jgi:hypothetical protein
MATASQKMMDMRFLLVMRGVAIALPASVLPVMKMPLVRRERDEEEEEDVSIFYASADRDL